MGGFAAGYTYQHGRAPYRGSPRNYDHTVLYLYEGDTFYAHGTRVGFKINQSAWRFDGFLRHRYEGWTQDSVPTSAVGMAFREPGIDAGVSARLKTSWGTPYVEVLHDVSKASRGSELKLGYWNEWGSGNWSLKPHAALSFRDAKLNDFYYGVQPGEATAIRPAYTPGAGTDAELGLYAKYRLTAGWQLLGSVSMVRRSGAIRSSPIYNSGTDVQASIGFLYDYSPQTKLHAAEGKPLIVRGLYGFSSDCDMLQIVRLSCTSTHTADKTDIWGFDVGRKLVTRAFDWPVDLGGFVGVLRHREKGLQNDFWQVHGYLKAWFYGFPWDSYVRTRIGFGGGVSYAEQIPAMEIRDQAFHGRGTWKTLMYLDPTIDFSIGDLVRAPSLKETWLGMGVSHRSGMFGKSQLFGDVTGGSNYIYAYVEHTFR